MVQTRPGDSLRVAIRGSPLAELPPKPSDLLANRKVSVGASNSMTGSMRHLSATTAPDSPAVVRRTSAAAQKAYAELKTSSMALANGSHIKDNGWTFYLPHHIRDLYSSSASPTITRRPQTSPQANQTILSTSINAPGSLRFHDALQYTSASPSPTTPEVPDIPKMLELWGVIGIVDISGYSRLASLLYKKTENAGEVLQRVVNEVFEPILDMIREHGGDVVKFAGDAILVCWSQSSSIQHAVTIRSDESCDLNTLAAIQNGASIAATIATSPPPPKSSDTDLNAQEPSSVEKLNIFSHAVTCCWKIVKMMRGYTKTIPELSKPAKLDVHISLASDMVHHVHVGIKGIRREYFLSGPATRLASSLLDKAKRGELVVDTATWKDESMHSLRSMVVFDVNDRENFVLVKNVKQEALQATLRPCETGTTELSPKLYRSVREYLSDYAVHRLFKQSRKDTSPGLPTSKTTGLQEVNDAEDTVGEHDINELRRIVVMFIKFKPSCEIVDRKDAVVFYQLCMSLTIEALTECEGQLRQFAVDDKTESGCAALCVWGLPPQSHEVEELFALKMALKMRRGVSAMGIKTNIGIAAGPAFTGYVGNATRRDHTILGDCVNLAARYLSVPCNEKYPVVCDETIYHDATKDRFVFSSLGHKKIKGKDGTVECYVLVDQKAPQRAGITLSKLNKAEIEKLLYRKAVASELISVFTEWKAGNPKSIVLEGESGQGKTFLVSYLASHAQDDGAVVWNLQASEYDQSSAFHVFKGFAWNVLNLTLDHDVQVSYPSELIQAASGFIVPENAHTKSLNVDQRNQQLYELVQRLISRISEVKPFVLVIDDCQWCDYASWKFIRTLVKECSRLLIVLLGRPKIEYRNHACAEIANFIQGEPTVVTFTLSGLSEQNTFDLVSHKAQRLDLPAKELVKVANTIYTQSGGNLSIIARLINNFVTASEHVPRDQAAEMFEAQLRENEANSSSMRAIILSQFDKLNPNLQSLLKIASCMDGEFALKDVYELAQLQIPFEEVSRELAGWDTYKFCQDIRHLGSGDDEGDRKKSRLRTRTKSLTFYEKGTPTSSLAALNASNPALASKNVDENIRYQFRHALIQSTIYNALLLEKRQECHLIIAKYYEEQHAKGRDDEAALLSKIYYHYSKTNFKEDRLYYMERMATVFSEKSMVQEARIICQEMLDLVAQQPHILKNMISNMYESSLDDKTCRKLEKLKLARWNVILAEMSLLFNDKDGTMKALRRAMLYFGIQRPLLYWWSSFQIINYLSRFYENPDGFEGPPDLRSYMYTLRDVPELAYSEALPDVTRFFRVYTNMARSFDLPENVFFWSLLQSIYTSFAITTDPKIKIELTFPAAVALYKTRHFKLADAMAEYAEKAIKTVGETDVGDSASVNTRWLLLLNISSWALERNDISQAVEYASVALQEALTCGNPRAVVEAASVSGRVCWFTGKYDDCLAAGKYILDHGFTEDNEYRFPWLSAPLLPLIVASMELDRMSSLPLRVSRLLQRQIDQTNNFQTVLCNLMLLFHMEVTAGDVMQASLRVTNFFKSTQKLSGAAEDFFVHVLLLAKASHRFIITSIKKEPQLLTSATLKSLHGTFRNLRKKMVENRENVVCGISISVCDIMITMYKDVSRNLDSFGATNHNLISTSPSNGSHTAPDDALSLKTGTPRLVCPRAAKHINNLLASSIIDQLLMIKSWLLELKGRHDPETENGESIRAAFHLATQTGAKSKKMYLQRSFENILGADMDE